MSRFKDETNNVYGHLTALRVSHKEHGRYFWLCQCDCGQQSIVDGNHLRTGHTTSCGCRKNVRHGYVGTSEYVTWCDMLSRCNNPNNVAYPNYGGRGISVCERWLEFENFIADMGDKPLPNLTLDRIDNDGNYELLNCKWATHHEQMLNRRNNHTIQFNGETKCLSEWAESQGILAATIHTRLKRGWSTKRALTVLPPKKNHLTLTHNNVTRPLSEWSKMTGIKYATLKNRLRSGWTPAQILDQTLYPNR